MMIVGGLGLQCLLENRLPVLDRGGSWWKSLLYSATQSDLRLGFVVNVFTWFALAQIFICADPAKPPVGRPGNRFGPLPPKCSFADRDMDTADEGLELAQVDDVGPLILPTVLVLP
ncbi:hypothetical protein XH97_01715 [Bradyrhizobium sp. CCBAU 53380]|nr:hypothetical protein [Bradyrhizobium sp. CCBAU 53380]